MPDLTPITRDEKLWSGENLEPITRREMYIKHLYDETQVIPDKPITREEMFILKAGEELHDVTIEQLTATENRTYSEEGVAYSPVIVNVPQTTLTTLDVTENGTYTAPSGTAYDEVDVNVPLPENAYLLKDIEGTPSDIATFTDGSALPMPKLEIAVEPQQDLHGYDAPWVGGAGKNKIPNIPSSYTSGEVLVDYGSNKSFNGYALSFKFSGSFANGGASFFIGKDDNDNNTVILTPQNMKKVSDGSSLVANTTYTNESVYFTSNANVNVRKFLLYTYPSFTNPTFTDCQFENGNTVTTYQPYANICPISGWSAVDVTVADDVDNPTTTETITIQLGSTYYGGKLDVVSGVMTVNKLFKKGTTVARVGQTGSGLNYVDTTNVYTGLVQNALTISDRYIQIDTSQSGADGKFRVYNGELTIYDDRFTDTTTAQSYLNDVEFCYELATPLTIQLTPTQVNSLLGSNNIWADCGKIIDGQYFSKEV